MTSQTANFELLI